MDHLPIPRMTTEGTNSFHFSFPNNSEETPSNREKRPRTEESQDRVNLPAVVVPCFRALRKLRIQTYKCQKHIDFLKRCITEGFLLTKNRHGEGTKMAPNYAIIVMDFVERRFLSTQGLLPVVWWRYIDDIFFFFIFLFGHTLERHFPHSVRPWTRFIWPSSLRLKWVKSKWIFWTPLFINSPMVGWGASCSTNQPMRFCIYTIGVVIHTNILKIYRTRRHLGSDECVVRIIVLYFTIWTLNYC